MSDIVSQDIAMPPPAAQDVTPATTVTPSAATLTAAPTIKQSSAVSKDAFTVPMYHIQEKKWYDAPADQVDGAVRSGQYTFQQGAEIRVMSPDGQPGTIPADYANQAWAQGYTYNTPQRYAAFQQQQAQDSQQRISGDQPLTAAIAGAARMATGGLSSVALHAGGLSDVEKATADLNPIATGAGEIAGVAGSVLLTGGMASAAKLGLGRTAMGLGMGAEMAEGANVFGQAASKLGNLAAKGVTSTLGEAMPARIAASVAKNAVEGAVYGTGSAIGETAMGSPNDLYDNLAAHVSTGAMIGGSLGGVFGVASEAKPAITKMLSTAADTVGNIVQDTAQKAVSLAGRVSGLTAEQASQAGEGVRAFYGMMDKTGGVGAKVLADTGKDITNADAIVADTINTTKAALTGKSADVAVQFQHALSSANGDLQSAAQLANDTVQKGQATFQDLMLADKAPLTGAHAEQLDSLYAAADKLMDSGNKAVKSLGQDMDAVLGQKATTQGEAAAQFNKIADLTNNTLKLPAIVGDDAGAIRKMYLDAKSAFLTHGNDATVSVYKALQDNQTAAQALSELAQNITAKAMKVPAVLADSGYQMAKTFDVGAAATWFANPQNRQVANDTFAMLSAFKPQIEQISAGLKNVDDVMTVQAALKAKMTALKGGDFSGSGEQIYNAIRMTGVEEGSIDKLAQYQSVLANPNVTTMEKLIAARQFLGYPVHGDMQKLADGQKLIDHINAIKGRETRYINPGSAVAAVKSFGASLVYSNPVAQTTLGTQMGAMAKVMRQADKGARLVKDAVNHTADALTGKIAQSLAQAVGVTQNDATTVTDLRKNYQNTANQLSSYQHTGTALNSIAPMAAQVVDQRHQQAIQYIQSKLPQDPLRDTSIMFNKSNFIPSDQQLASFNRTVQAVNNPIHALADLADNGGSQESIDVLKNVYPSIMQKVHDAVLDNLIKAPQDLSYQQKLNLSSLFGVATDYSLQPQVVQRMQQTFADASQQQGRPQGSPSKSRTVKIDVQPLAQMATDSQKTTYGLQDT